MESPKTPRDGDMPGVTSRSGRVIKKSTKLMDFTSPDDIDSVKAKKHASASKKLHMTSFTHIKMEPELDINHTLPSRHYDDSYDEETYPPQKGHDDSYTPDQDELDGADDDFHDSDSDDRLLVVKEDDPEIEFAAPRRSIYMTEKSSKKKMMKDGKIVMGKAQRKDKGKTRYTAYMLWAKDARHSISLSSPEMDFASVSKRLGEMWANVPTNVKYNWKRRAKRLANKIKKSNGAKGQAPQPSKYMQQKYYLNKGSANATPAASATTATATSTPLTKQQKQFQKLLKSEKSKTQSIQNAQKQHKEKAALTPNTSSSFASPSTSVSSRNNSLHLNKPLDLAPIDVAAHLKLLGESLINIGERLSQHEGQIAVSGSFSVLLDSILCAMGSLMCCLNFVPELNFQNDPPLTNYESADGTEEDPRNLFQSIMDNVHYIMPGL